MAERKGAREAGKMNDTSQKGEVPGVVSTTDSGNRPVPRGSLNYAYPIRPGSQQPKPKMLRGAPTETGRRPPPPSPPTGSSAGPLHHASPLTEIRDSEGHVQPSGKSPFDDEAEDFFESQGSSELPRNLYGSSEPASTPFTTSQATSSHASSSSESTLGVIPNFPSPAAADPRYLNSSRPQIRRGASSHYSQQTLAVSPIPEEMASRQPSYASSAAIPSNWDTDAPGFNPQARIPEKESMENPRDGKLSKERSTVRQASMGRKSKPMLTEIRNSDKGKGHRSHSTSSSEESIKAAAASVASGVLAAGGVTGVVASTIRQNSPARKGSPILVSSPAGTPTIMPHRSVGSLSGLTRSAMSSQRSLADSPIAQPPIQEDYFTEKTQPTRSSTNERPIPLALMKELAMSKELGHHPADAHTSLEMATDPEKSSPTSTGKRRIPPRLDMSAVREAEARGSLTSLPDLIARATKLAARLEHGRPDSKMWGRDSFFGARSTRSNARDTDSISDILGSFPRPVLATPSRLGNRKSRGTISQWPLPEEFDAGQGTNGSVRNSRRERRICGLPMWAFIILVILALVVIAAAVIVPLQLVNLSKNQKKTRTPASSALAQCQASVTCANGGENIATDGFCGCVCTNGFMGANCTKQEDTSCTSYEISDHSSSGIKNATIGSMLPRLFEKAESAYNVALDPSLILAQFSKADVSCTLQNALVNFLGKTSPDSDTTKRTVVEARAVKRNSLLIDTASVITASATATASSSSASATSTREPAVDQDAVDFGRVAVLYIVQTESVNNADTAQQQLNTAFKTGKDFGNVDAGNGNTILLDNRSIRLSNGKTVGGVSVNTTATTSSTSATPSTSMRLRFIQNLGQ